MKKGLLTFALCLGAFGVGFGLNNIAFSDIATYKIGYVNTQKLATSSKALKSAQDVRTKETQDMLKWYDVANKEIQSQKTPEAKKAMITKYEAQLTQKKKAINDSYAKKIKTIDAQMSGVIAQKAKDLGYNIVLKEDSVLFGGDDITAHVLPLVK